MPLGWGVNHLDQVHGQLEQLGLQGVAGELELLVLELLGEATHLRVVFQPIVHHQGDQQEDDLLH